MHLKKKLLSEREYSLNQDWNLIYKDNKLKISVPGDVNTCLYENGIIEDPLYASNFGKLGWISKSEWIYINHFDVSKEDLKTAKQYIKFEMIDTYSSIYLNGVKLGETSSMFIPYEFDIKGIVREKNNELKVVIHPIRNYFNSKIEDKYDACFNKERIFLRTKQCSFGWDWAPDLPGVGIAGNVSIYFGTGLEIDSYSYKTCLDGHISFVVEPNFSNRFDKKHLDKSNYKIRLSLASTPGEQSSLDIVNEVTLRGKKNIINSYIPNRELWWPNGYGKQPLYRYRIELLDENNGVLDYKDGLLGIREIEIDESPCNLNRRYFRIKVNGTYINVKGSNWVPASTFVGSIEDEKYIELINDAKEANMNMLRVWGGGIYEKDIFYKTCDKLGILVYQDFMFSCQFIPDDIDGFIDIIIEEATYQIKRLRKYTCLALYASGNELANSFRDESYLKYSHLSQNILLPGLVSTFDQGRRCLSSSPYSVSEVGNDLTSGDAHVGGDDSAFFDGKPEQFMEYIDRVNSMFISEAASLGLTRVSSLLKFLPKEKLFPVSEEFKDHLSANPYCPIPECYSRLIAYASLYKKNIDNIDDFVKYSIMSHMDIIREAFLKARSLDYNYGFMNWMYNDIWGDGTWSLVDYYLEKKGGFYSFKRNGKSVKVFSRKEEDGYYLYLVNDSKEEVNGKIKFAIGDIKEDKLSYNYIDVKAEPNSIFKTRLDIKESNIDNYFYSSFLDDCDIYFPFIGERTYRNEYSYNITRLNEFEARIDLSSTSLTKMIVIDYPSSCLIEDNYFDMVPSQSRSIKIISKEKLDLSKIKVRSLLDNLED